MVQKYQTATVLILSLFLGLTQTQSVFADGSAQRETGKAKMLLPPVPLPAFEGLIFAAEAHCPSSGANPIAQNEKGLLVDFEIIGSRIGDGSPIDTFTRTLSGEEPLIVEIEPQQNPQLVSIQVSAVRAARCNMAYTYLVSGSDGTTRAADSGSVIVNGNR